MCSTRDWSDWCSTRLCVAEGVQKLYHGRRFPRVIPWCTRLYFSEGKDLRLLGLQVPYHCVPTVNPGYRSGIMASATFRGCPLNTALCIRTQDQNILFTLHFSSSWANHMVFFFRRNPWYHGALYGVIILYVIVRKAALSLVLHGWKPLWYKRVCYWGGQISNIWEKYFSCVWQTQYLKLRCRATSCWKDNTVLRL